MRKLTDVKTMTNSVNLAWVFVGRNPDECRFTSIDAKILTRGIE
jgi:hypothetical protein